MPFVRCKGSSQDGFLRRTFPVFVFQSLGRSWLTSHLFSWDSFWIIEGLLRTQGSFTEIALNIIENFLDIINDIGFMPNGARQYYMNRSQPPVR